METSSSSELSDLHMKYLYAPLFWEDAEVQQKIALCLPCARPLKQCEPICKNPHGRPYDDGNFTGVFMVLFVDEEQETEFKYFIQDTEWLQANHGQVKYSFEVMDPQWKWALGARPLLEKKTILMTRIPKDVTDTEIRRAATQASNLMQSRRDTVNEEIQQILNRHASEGFNASAPFSTEPPPAPLLPKLPVVFLPIRHGSAGFEWVKTDRNDKYHVAKLELGHDLPAQPPKETTLTMGEGDDARTYTTIKPAVSSKISQDALAAFLKKLWIINGYPVSVKVNQEMAEFQVKFCAALPPLRPSFGLHTLTQELTLKLQYVLVAKLGFTEENAKEMYLWIKKAPGPDVYIVHVSHEALEAAFVTLVGPGNDFVWGLYHCQHFTDLEARVKEQASNRKLDR